MTGDAPAARSASPGAPVVVVMGVSGSGKSTVGAALAQALGVAYVEGDALHPPANVARMAAGTALTDTDRAEWLDRVADALAAAAAVPGGGGAVVACSALKRRYRDRLRRAAPALRLVFLDGDAGLVAARLAGRAGHYMPPSLLPSQFETLERPGADEQPIVLDIAEPPHRLVEAAVHALAATAPVPDAAAAADAGT